MWGPRAALPYFSIFRERHARRYARLSAAPGPNRSNTENAGPHCSNPAFSLKKMAERKRFELLVQFPVHTLSRRAPSASSDTSPYRKNYLGCFASLGKHFLTPSRIWLASVSRMKWLYSDFSSIKREVFLQWYPTRQNVSVKTHFEMPMTHCGFDVFILEWAYMNSTFINGHASSHKAYTPYGTKALSYDKITLLPCAIHTYTE